MRKALALAVLLLVCCVGPGSAMAGKKKTGLPDWPLKKVLKEMDKAAKGVKGMEARVDYAEVIGPKEITGEGTLYVSFEGKVRADIRGDNPRTFLSLSPYLYIYMVHEKKVEIYNTDTNPHRLVQYALNGFAPTGNALKKHYNVAVTEETTIDDQKVLLVELTAKSKTQREALAKMYLWIDQETFLPAKQKIVHAAGTIHLIVRFTELTRDDEIDETLFEPRWPAGTEKVLTTRRP